MAAKEKVPIKREREVPARREETPFFSLWDRVDRLFGDFARGFELAPFRAMEERFGAFAPVVDMHESDKEVVVTAELPGMDEKDIDVSLTGDRLTIEGEKKEEKEEKKKDYYRMERSYGSFRRVVPLPEGIDQDKASADFKKGVLTVTIPKTKEAQTAARKIAVKAEK